MAIGIRAVSVGTNSTTNNVVTKPAGTVDGDYLLAISFGDNGTSVHPVPPAGGGTGATWVQTGTTKTQASVGTGKTWGKRALSEPASWTWTIAGGNTASIIWVLALTGVDATTPVDVVVVWSNGSSVTPSATPGLTPVTIGDLLVVFYYTFANTTGVNAYSQPAGMAEQGDTSDAPASPYISSALDTQLLASTAATGVRNSTQTLNRPWIGGMLALRPAAGSAVSLAGTGSNVSSGSAGLSVARPVAALGSNVSSAAANLTFRLTSQILDDFDDNTINPVIWPGNYGGVSEQGGRARVPCLSSAWSGFQSANVYALDQTPAYRVYPQAAGGATLEAYAALILRSPTQTAGTDVTMTIERVWGELRMQLRVGYGDSDPAAAITYDPVDHAWIRIRRSGPDIIWETAPDAAGVPGTWTTRRQATSPAYFATTNDFALILEAHRNDGTDDYAEFDTTHVPAAVALDGAGSNVSSGSAALTLAQALSGSGAAVSGGSGVLTRAAGLAALGSNVGGASADLARARPLDGMGSNVSSAGADIGRARPLAALGSSVSSGLAAAGVARALLSSSPGVSGGSGGLTLAVALAALGSSASSSTADLSTSSTIALDAAGSNVSGASAGLTVARAFSADGSNAGSAGATLGLVRELAALGSAVSGAGATVATQRPLSATGAASSGGSGSLARAVPLDAVGASVAGATAALSVTSPQGLDAVGANVSSADAALSVARPLGALGSSTSGGSAVLGRAFGLDAVGSNVSGSGAVLDGGRGLVALGSGASGAAAALLAARAFDALAANAGSGTAELDVIAAVGLEASGAGVSGAVAELAVSRTLAGSGGSASSGTAVLGRALALAAVGRAVSSGRGQLSLRSIVYPLVTGEIVDLLAEMDAGQLVELAARLYEGEIVDLEQYLHAGDLVEA